MDFQNVIYVQIRIILLPYAHYFIREKNVKCVDNYIYYLTPNVISIFGLLKLFDIFAIVTYYPIEYSELSNISTKCALF